MKVVLFSLFCIVGTIAAPNNINGRIVGGAEAEEGQFPYVVSARYYYSHDCGGSILDETTILIAAHCIYGFDPKKYEVVVGTTKLDDLNATHYAVESLVWHEYYDPQLYLNDIGILKLAEPIEFNDKVQPLPLPISDIGEGEEVIAAGWGLLYYPEGPIPNELHYVHLNTITSEKCQALYPLPVTQSHLCTMDKIGEGVCQGDSGGPLVDLNGYHVGIVSWIYPCAKGYPDVFTRVYSYLNWIEANRY